MKRHPEIGDALCAPLQSLRRVRPIVLGHHERIDGSGYPAGLKGDAVPLLAQIVGIVDVYDALTSKRSYRPAWTVEDAIRYLHEEVAKGRFHREHVETFIDTLEQVPGTSTH
jgi:putative two-component system response regulator